MTGGYVWYVTALLLVIGFIFALAWTARRLGLMGRLGAVGGKRRLSLVEVLPLDAKRRLVLLRRDGAEHLVLLGLSGDVVIERGIAATAPADFAAALDGGKIVIRRALILLAGAALSVLGTSAAMAQTVTLDLGDGGSSTGHLVQLLLMLTVLSLAPAILITVTSFTRIIVVLSFLRNALGTQQTPPNIVLVSLALFLTGFVMAPSLQASYDNGIAPLIENKIDDTTAFERTVAPLHDFMMAHVRSQDLLLFTGMAKIEPSADPKDTPLRALVPAFMVSELRRAFEIGFLLFLPFLVIDIVVASILMSMGMMMLPPVTISLPFKLIFFVLVDGWYLVAGSLVQSFGTG